MEKDLKYVVNLILGDSGGDGHCKKSMTSIMSNCDKQEIKLAYKKGTELVGFDFTAQVCSDFGDNKISIEYYNKLVELGLPNESYHNDSDEIEEEDSISLWLDNFTEIYLFIVKLGNPDFDYEFLQNSDIDIGGYGLFE
jgi:hypothetical protein